MKKIKIVRTGNQNSALAMESAVLSTIQKKSQQQSKFFPLSVQTDKNFPFFKSSVFFSKRSSLQVKCRSESRSNYSQRMCDTFFCLATKSDETAVTLSSAKPIFHQMIICTRNKHFWRLRQKFCITKLKRFFQISKKMKKNENWLEKQYQFCTLETQNAVLSTVQKKFDKSRKFFHSRSQNDLKKSCSSRKSLFCFQDVSLRD